MATERIDIGRCTCPVCKSPKAHLRVNRKQVAYVMCNACNSQTQARSDRSDELLRQLHIREAEAEPVRTAVAPPSDVQTAVAPAPVGTPAPPKPRGWGVLG